MVASRATMSERMERVSMIRYSCLSGFHVAAAVSRAIVESSPVVVDVTETCFSFTMEVVIPN